MTAICHVVRIAVPAAELVPLVGTPQGLSRWWAEDVEPASDGAVALGFFGRATVYRLQLVEPDEPLMITWVCTSGDEWTGTRLVFSLEPGDGDTTLRFAHAGWTSPTDYFHQCNATWGALLYRLKATAEGSPRGPLFLRDGWGPL